MLLLNMNRKSYIVSLMAPLDLTFSDLERSKSRSLRIWLVRDLYSIDIFASSLLQPLIWMSQKRVCWRAGISTVPAVFLVAFRVDLLFFAADPSEVVSCLVSTSL